MRLTWLNIAFFASLLVAWTILHSWFDDLRTDRGPLLTLHSADAVERYGRERRMAARDAVWVAAAVGVLYPVFVSAVPDGPLAALEIMALVIIVDLLVRSFRKHVTRPMDES